MINIDSFSSRWIPFVHQKESKISQISPLRDLKDLNALAQFLTANHAQFNQWKTWKQEIKHFVSMHSSDERQLDEFLVKITEWGIEQDPQETMNIILEIVSVDILIKAVNFKQKNTEVPFTTISELAKKNLPLVTFSHHDSIKTSVLSEWRRVRPVVIYFIPNLIQIFIGAFSFLDPQKKFTSLWEKYLLLDIIYKFFSIPFSLVRFLEPILVVTTKVYAASVIIIMGTGILIACYQRWLKPMPDEISNCTNLDKEMVNGMIEPKVGQRKEMRKLIAGLEGNRPVLLIGHSGEGKTALVHHFIQLKYENKLSDKLKKLVTFEVDCGTLITEVEYNHSEHIKRIKDGIRGFEDRALIFFDEMDRLTKNEKAFQTFQHEFLDRKTHFVATITWQEFQKLRDGLGKDGSFLRRFKKIIIKSSSDKQSDKQNRLIISEYIKRNANDIHITQDAVEKLLEVTKDKDYLPHIGRPTKTLDLLNEAIGICRAVYNPHYISPELNKKEFEMLTFQSQHQGEIDSQVQKKNQELVSNFENLERELNSDKKHIQKIKKMIAQQHKMKMDYSKLTHMLAESESSKNQQTENSVSQNDQIKYLWFCFYAFEALKKGLAKEINKVANKHPIQVDAMLIQKVFRESKKVENKLLSKGKNPSGKIKRPNLIRI